jgi:hypothetical protein
VSVAYQQKPAQGGSIANKGSHAHTPHMYTAISAN